ncbi:MAG TPA: 2-oxo acid dehydrogenase subunit E2, partial [Polyangia bacterium]
MPNLELVRKDDVSSFRKIAIGTWRTAYDPSVYGTIELRMDEAMKYIAAFREKTGKKLTVSHLMAKAAAMVLKECPDANAILRWNRVYLRKRIGVFFQVVMTDEGAHKVDLSGATLYDVEAKSLAEIYDEFNAKVDAVRARKDPAL